MAQARPPQRLTDPFVQALLRKLENYPREDLPRYLFRAYSVNSRGKNEATLFAAAASQRLSPQESLPSLSELDLSHFAQDATKHLMYTRSDTTFKSPLISFTSSLLVALGCGVKAYLEVKKKFEGKKRFGGKKKFEGKNKFDVKIAILDTQQITSEQPIVPSADLKSLVNTYLRRRVLIPGDSVDEYLAYDRVDVNTSCASIRRLEAELFEFMPELPDHDFFTDKWPKPTISLREKLFVEPRVVSESEYRLLRQLSSAFPGEEHQLAVTVHLLSMRNRFVETDALLRKAITAFFRIEQLQNFVRVEAQFNIGPESLVLYKYTSAGHGVTNSTAPELRLYSALVSTVCDHLMARQNEKFMKTTQQEILETICNPAADAFTKLDHEIANCGIGNQPATDAKVACFALKTALPMWRRMHISEILDDAVLRNISTLTENAKRLAANLRAENAPLQTASRTSSSAPHVPDRRSPEKANEAPRQTRRTRNVASSSVFSSILASIDSPKKRKRADGEEFGGRKEEAKKLLRTS